MRAEITFVKKNKETFTSLITAPNSEELMEAIGDLCYHTGWTIDSMDINGRRQT